MYSHIQHKNIANILIIHVTIYFLNKSYYKNKNEF